MNVKAIPHNSGVRIAKQDFSSECTNNQYSYWRMGADFWAV